jgi:hypothetical protein
MRSDNAVTTPVLVGRWPRVRYLEADAVPAHSPPSTAKRMLWFATTAADCAPAAAAEHVAAALTESEPYRALIAGLVRGGLLPSLAAAAPPRTSQTSQTSEPPTVAAERFQGEGEPFPGHWREFPAAWRPEMAENLLRPAVRSLPVLTRLVVLLVDLVGLPETAAAAVLGIAAPDAENVLHLGRAEIRASLERSLADSR